MPTALAPLRSDFVDRASGRIMLSSCGRAIQVPGLIEYKAAGGLAAIIERQIEGVQESVRPLMAVLSPGRELEDSAAISRVLEGSSVEIAGCIRHQACHGRPTLLTTGGKGVQDTHRPAVRVR